MDNDFSLGYDLFNTQHKTKLGYNLDAKGSAPQSPLGYDLSDTKYKAKLGYNLDSIAYKNDLDELDEMYDSVGKPPKQTTPNVSDIPKGKAESAVKEAVEEGTQSLGKIGKWKGVGMVAGALALGGFALSAASNRGQLSNAQLYGQRPLY